jgi:3-oxoadipate enol-lactonase
VAVYSGFPRALNALEAVDEALSDSGVPRSPSLGRISLADHETRVASIGDQGPAVLLVHALGLDWRMWEPVMAPLADCRRIFAYDIRSHVSAFGSPTPFSIADAAADLIGSLTRSARERTRRRLVVLRRDRPDGRDQRPGAVLVAGSPGTADYPFDAFEDRARSGENEGMEAQVVPSLTRWFTPAGLARNQWGVRYARERIRRGRARSWAATWRCFKDLDARGYSARGDAGLASAGFPFRGQRHAPRGPGRGRTVRRRPARSRH